MNDKTRSEFKAWVERLVHASLPFDLEKRLILGEPLRADEWAKLTAVLQLVSEEQRLRDHAELVSGHEAIISEIKRQGGLTRREFNKLSNEVSKQDRRTAGQRTCIDKAVHLYVLRHDIELAPGASFQSCCERYWPLAKKHFRDIAQYKNITSYDYRTFYDIEALKSLLKGGLTSI